MRGSPGIYGSAPAPDAVSARAAPKIPNGAAAPRVPARVSTERREKVRRFACGTTFDKLLLISLVFMASSPLCCLASVLLSPRNSKSPMQVGPALAPADRLARFHAPICELLHTRRFCCEPLESRAPVLAAGLRPR